MAFNEGGDNKDNKPTQGKNNSVGNSGLTPAQEQRLVLYNKQNSNIYKTSRKLKKGQTFDNARPLTKVRRLYTARIPRKVYGDKMVEIAKLRTIAGSKGGSRLGGGGINRKNKRALTTFLLLLIIVAVLGTGSVVTLLLLTGGGGDAPFTGTLTIVETTDEEGHLEGSNVPDYILGNQINQTLTASNATNKNLFICFYFKIDAVEPLYTGLNLNQLQITPNYGTGVVGQSESGAWFSTGYPDTDGFIKYYYIYTLGSGQNVRVLDGFTIDLKPAYTNHSDWTGIKLKVTFNLDYTYDLDSVTDWPSGWQTIYNQNK